MLNETKHISVLNYNENCVCINIAPSKSVILEASEYGEPNVLPLTLDEIRFANNSSIFKNGILEFPEDIEDEVYETLRINKGDVLKLNEIRDILISPTKEGLKRIISIKSSSDFERVRGQFFKLKHEGYKLTLDIADLIARRYKELVNNDKTRVAELEKEIAEMKKLLEIAVNSNKKEPAKEQEVTVKKVDVQEKKSPGRPKKTL